MKREKNQYLDIHRQSRDTGARRRTARICLHSETDIYCWSLLDDVIRMFVIWRMYEKESAQIHLSDQFLFLHTLLTWKSSFICLSSKAAVTAAGALWEIILQSPWDGKRDFRSKCTHARMSVVQWGSILKFRWWSAVIYNRMCLGCSIMTKIIRIILPRGEIMFI